QPVSDHYAIVTEERARRSPVRAVNRARDQHLAGAGLAENKLAGVAARDALDGLAEHLDRLRVSDQGGSVRGGLDAGAQELVLVLEPIAEAADLLVLRLERTRQLLDPAIRTRVAERDAQLCGEC